MLRRSDIDTCLRGAKLYGDDFSPDEIAMWFEGEREGYAEIWAKDRIRYRYEFHALNRARAFRYLPNKRLSHVLSIGGAYGDELLPIIGRVSRVTILEPSEAFPSTELNGVPIEYVKPSPSGSMPFPDRTFDLVTCFGCLHHIPNVTKVVGELFRCLVPGGIAFIREPIVSMGDWRQERRGLTKQERGIPLGIFRRILRDAGFIVRREHLCVFPLIPRLRFLFGEHVYNSSIAVLLDDVLSRCFRWNDTYHPTRFIEKLRPSTAMYVIEKPQPGATLL
jgi:SAM-dependent methyltransferase